MTIYEQGAAEENARRNKAKTAQYIATMKRRLANIETELKTLRQTDEVIETRLKGVNSSFDEAAERFVYRLWNDSANGRPVRIDLSDSDTLSFFLRESIAEKLPGLIHRFTSKSCDGSPRSNIEKTIAALDTEADGLRQQITDHGQ
jgi:hypothetical protein